MIIEKFNNNKHREQVISLWSGIFGYSDRRNDPGLNIDNKLAVDDGLFVALDKKSVVGTIMAGYDGHRGWIYSLAVLPENRGTGVGTALLKHAESYLTHRGCVKINLQILSSNSAVKEFYKGHGYHIEERISMGKQIEENL